jgi:hypothetical protein
LLDGERHELEKLRRTLGDGHASAQKTALPPGQVPRRSRRVAHMFKVKIVGDGFSETTATMNVSTGGFATLMADAPPRGARVHFVLHTKRGRLEGTARLVSTGRRDRSWLASFAIEEMSDNARRALDEVVLEQVLASLAR